MKCRTLFVSAVLLALAVVLLGSPAYAQIATHVVISEVYGGGGNTGAYWKQDFIELYNPTTSPVTMTNWSVQYQSATGSGPFSLIATFSGTVPARGFFLIQCSQGAGGVQDIPTPDATAALSLGGTAGKVALVNDGVAIEFPTDPTVVDFVGFGSTSNKYEGAGPTATLSNTTSAERKAQSSSTAASMGTGGVDTLAGNGWDTNNNSADFVLRGTIAGTYPDPQNTSSPTEIPPTIGNSAPIISVVARSAFVAEVSGVDTVTANITDIDGTVTIARLHVRVNGGAFDSSFTMSVTTPPQYRAVIPASKHAAAGNLVEYFISAIDDSSAYASTVSALQGYFVGNAPISSIKSFTLANIVGYGARINGTLNVKTNTFSNGQGFIQDATGGLQMFATGGLPALNAGRNVKVQGTVIAFSGAYELSTPNFAFVDTSLGTSTLIPVTLTLPLTQTPDYVNEGKLVQIAGMVTDSTGNFASPRSYVYREADNDTITVRVESNGAANNLVGLPILGTPINAIGILSHGNGFQRLKPRQASDMGYAAGDGTGTATITPTFRFSSQTGVAETLLVTGDGLNTLEGVSVTIPETWTWDGTTRTLSGTGFSGASSAVTGTGATGDPWVITISGAAVTNVNTGTLRVGNLGSPSVTGLTTWATRTRVAAGVLNSIAVQPTVNIVSGFEAVTTGNWSDPATWSGNAVPGAANDVTFTTLNVTVTIDIANAQCNNLTMTGSGSASNSGPVLQFAAAGSSGLTVNGNLTISGGSGGGGGDRGGRAKLTSNGNTASVLTVKKTLFSSSSNSVSNGDAGMNMNEGTVKLTGSTSDSLRFGASSRLGNLEIGDGVSSKTVTTHLSVSSATMNIRSLTVKQGSTFWIGTPNTTNTLTIGNTGVVGLPMLAGGVTVENGAALKVQESTAGSVVANINLDGGGITNNGTIDLVSPATAELTGCVYNLKIGGHSAGSSGTSITVGGTAVGEFANVSVDSNHTVTLNQDMNIAPGYKLTVISGLLAETAGNTVIGSAEATRTLTQSVVETFGGLGLEINAAGGAPGATTVLRRTGTAVTSGGSQSILRWFDITPANNTGLNATLAFFFDNSELNGNVAASLRLYESTNAGAAWTERGGTPNAGLRRIDLSGIGSFARWTAADTANPLGAYSVGVSVISGWNMISNPVTTADDSVRELFTTSSFAYAFAFVAGVGYQQEFRLANGAGYWGKFPAAAAENLFGVPRTVDTVEVATGWNMVGSISEPVDTGSITSIPPGINASGLWYGYNGSYVFATSLQPGQAYWVKASAPGAFVLNAGPAPEKRAASIGASPVMNTITISDAAGRSQTLSFAPGEGSEIPMPPPAPEGSFDARFAGQEGGAMVRIHADGTPLPIDIRSAAAPLTVAWDIRTGSYSLDAGRGMKPVSGQGSLVLASPVSRLILGSSDESAVPAEFVLLGNYPNPFNPMTSIRFGLPAQSLVTVRVYNLLGQQIAEPVNGTFAAGYHTAVWSGGTTVGAQAGSGVYFYKLEASPLDGSHTFTDVRKMMLVK